MLPSLVRCTEMVPASAVRSAGAKEKLRVTTVSSPGCAATLSTPMAAAIEIAAATRATTPAAIAIERGVPDVPSMRLASRYAGWQRQRQ